MKPRARARFPIRTARRGDRWKIDESQLQRYKLSSASSIASARSCPYRERADSELEDATTLPLYLRLPLPSPGLSNRTSRYYTSYPRHQIAINPFCRPALHRGVLSRSRSLSLPPVYFQFSRAISVLAPFRIRLFLRLSCPPVLWMTVPLLWSSAPDPSVYSGANNATHTQTCRIAIHVGESKALHVRVCVCARIRVCAYVEKSRLGNLGSCRAFHCRRTFSPGPTTYTHCRSCHPWLNCNDLNERPRDDAGPPRFLWRLVKSGCLPDIIGLSQTRRNLKSLVAMGKMIKNEN